MYDEFDISPFGIWFELGPGFAILVVARVSAEEKFISSEITSLVKSEEKKWRRILSLESNKNLLTEAK